MRTNSDKEIDLFLNGEMPKDALSIFSKQLETDTRLRANVHLMQLIVDGIGVHEESVFKESVTSVEEAFDQAGFFSDAIELAAIEGVVNEGLTNVHQLVDHVANKMQKESFFTAQELSDKQSKLIPIRSIRPKLAIAASILLLLSVGWYLLRPLPLDGPQLFAAHFIPAEDLLGPQVSDDINELGFGQNDETLLIDLQQLMTAYTAGNHLDFLTNYQSIERSLDGTPYENEVSFYVAQVQLSTGNSEGARLILEALQQKEVSTNPDQLKWYLSLAYINLGMNSKAKEILHLIAPDFQNYSQVETLLNQLDT